MKKKLIVGSRGSSLALKQANLVIDALKEKLIEVEFEIKIITTTGDKILDRALDKIGGKGLFVFEIEKALIDEEIDIAIHSMKDVPAFLEEVFEISPLLKREDPRDILISKDNIKFKDLPTGAVIGTSSLRRIIQLRELRGDLNYLPIRGNIDTRIKKMNLGEFNGIVLAAAGLNRMGWSSAITEYFDIGAMIPAVGQGALCIEYRKADTYIKNIIKEQNKNIEIRGILGERAFLEAVNGSCSVAMGAFGEITGEELTLKGFYSENPEGKIIIEEVRGAAKNYKLLGKALAARIKK
ncbi:MAG TPA: hydroxymethylbilane synthase [Clostridiaceae bacterium]